MTFKLNEYTFVERQSDKRGIFFDEILRQYLIPSTLPSTSPGHSKDRFYSTTPQ